MNTELMFSSKKMDYCTPPALPDKKYAVIYADPPWGYRNRATRAAAERHYGTMSADELRSLPVADIAAEDCALFLWCTYPMFNDALELIRAWGFRYKTLAFQWVKENRKSGGYFMGLGNWTRANTEPCLLALRGKPARASGSVRQLVVSPVRRHSQKPDEVRDRIVELMGDVPRIELFARERSDGWDAWGDELEGGIQDESKP